LPPHPPATSPRAITATVDHRRQFQSIIAALSPRVIVRNRTRR
jgi:hypothetical protein